VPGEKERPAASFSPLLVEGAIEHPDAGEAWEYSILVTVRDGSGEEIMRHVAGVGALHPQERRSFTLAVEVFTPE
jgi:hypothetical protein